MRGLVRARAKQEIRLMELEFQPRRKFRLWESILNQIIMLVNRYFHSSPVYPVTKDKLDTALISARDPEIGLNKPNEVVKDDMGITKSNSDDLDTETDDMKGRSRRFEKDTSRMTED